MDGLSNQNLLLRGYAKPGQVLYTVDRYAPSSLVQRKDQESSEIQLSFVYIPLWEVMQRKRCISLSYIQS